MFPRKVESWLAKSRLLIINGWPLVHMQNLYQSSVSTTLPLSPPSYISHKKRFHIIQKITSYKWSCTNGSDQWTKYYHEQHITMNKIQRWTKYYDERNITMNKILWWPKYYDEQNITTNKILRWTKYYDEQNNTMNKILRWTKYDDQNITMTKILREQNITMN